MYCSKIFVMYLREPYVMVSMDELQWYCIFNSISVVSNRWKCDSERLRVTEPCYIEMTRNASIRI